MISKEQAAKEWGAIDERLYKDIEFALDVAIGGSADSPHIDVQPARINPRVRAKIVTKYSNGGWSVRITDGDQTDPTVTIRLS